MSGAPAIKAANGQPIKPPPITLRDLAARLTPNPALTIDGTLQMILDGIEKIDDQALARSIARANKAQQIGGDPGPLSDAAWAEGDLHMKIALISAAQALKAGLRMMAE